jgi:hypothetical protein
MNINTDFNNSIAFDMDAYLESKGSDLVIDVISPTSKIIRTGWFDNVHNWTLEEYEYDYLNGYLEHDYYESIEMEFLEVALHTINYWRDLFKYYEGEELFLRNGDEKQFYLMQFYYADRFVTHGFGGYIKESYFEQMKKIYNENDCPF